MSGHFFLLPILFQNLEITYCGFLQKPLVQDACYNYQLVSAVKDLRRSLLLLLLFGANTSNMVDSRSSKNLLMVIILLSLISGLHGVDLAEPSLLFLRKYQTLRSSAMSDSIKLMSTNKKKLPWKLA